MMCIGMSSAAERLVSCPIVRGLLEALHFPVNANDLSHAAAGHIDSSQAAWPGCHVGSHTRLVPSAVSILAVRALFSWL